MTTFDPGQVPDQWVKYSGLLDIWQDEEEPGDLLTFGAELGLSEEDLCQFIAWLPSGRNAEAPTDDGTARGVSRFFALKRLRVWAILRFGRTCFDLANDVAEQEQGSWANLVTAREAKARRKEILREVFLECATELRQSPATSSDETSPLLRALWHTELCATAPDESTVGLVSAFPLPGSIPEVFQRIAAHNVARSRSHLHQHADAVKVLESLADDAANEKMQDPTTLRLVGFPALASMADALTHLLRHVEARWYWTKGRLLAVKVENAYWQDYFMLKLAESRSKDPGELPDHSRPRLESLFQDATRKALHDAWLTTEAPSDSQVFEGTVYWRLAWHAAEPRELLSSLKGTMEDLRAIIEERGRAFRQPQAALTKDRKQKEILLLQRALLAARTCLSECAEEQARWLHPDPTSTVHQGFKDPATLMLAWRGIRDTCRALKEVEELDDDMPLDENLSEWLKTLMGRVKGFKNDFSRVVSAVELEQLIHEPSVTCQANPEEGKRTTPECRDFGCPANSLRIEEATPAAAGDDPSLRLEEATGAAHRDGPHRPALAGLDYVLTTMARSAAGFNQYLSGRTAEMVSDRNGEREEKGRRTPNIEFISLRRWNSFSPNLGSLAADTVGGGYLLRVWTGTNYLGIAIDPGYNFLENLFNEGLTIADVDLVAVTHAHPDHTDSITNLLTLVRESTKRSRKPKNEIRFAMSAGVLERYQEFLRAEAELVPEVVMLSWAPAPGNAASQSELAILASTKDRLSFDFSDVAAEGEPLAYLKAIPAYHEDGTSQDSIGFRITIPESNRGGQHQDELAVGILGDSRYHPELHKGLWDCDVVVLHLGAMLEDSSYRGAAEVSSIKDRAQLYHLHRLTPGGCREEAKKCAQNALYELLEENHLYWTGATKLVCDLLQNRETEGRAPLVVLSEFGEELRGGLRADLARRLERHFWDLRPEVDFPGVIPADVGLRIDVAKRKVRCAVCERYWTWKEMDAIAARPADEGLSFVCRDCQSLREHELGEILSRRRAQVRVPQKPDREDKEEATTPTGAARGSGAWGMMPAAARHPPPQS